MPSATQPELTAADTLTTADELASGAAAAARLVQDQDGLTKDRNEADTRFHIIDRVLVECLGYPRSDIRCEKAQDREYTDYEIGTPTLAIWEAKREGKIFEVPVKPKSKTIQNLTSLTKVSETNKEAVEQVNRYCRARGTEIAVATNGHQLIAFVAYDPNAGPSGNAFVIDSLEGLVKKLGRVWQLLSFEALKEGRLVDLLHRSTASRPPEKLSAYIPEYPQPKARTALQSSLRTIVDLLLIDIERQPEIERAFYEECYVESGGLSQNATVAKSILSARYASLVDGHPGSDEMTPVKVKKGRDAFTPALLAEAITSRPIILLGDVGVGKSSFIKHLKYVSAFDEFRHAIYIC